MKLPGCRICMLAAVFVAVWTVFFFVQSAMAAGEADETSTAALECAVEKSVHLYFSDRRSCFLRAEERVFARPTDALAFGRSILKMLIQGPRGEMIGTLPAGTAVRAFFIDGTTAVVDFTDAIRERHPGGCRTEMLTVFSIVNSLVLNMDGIDRIRILIDGRETDTLAGHIDLHPAYAADMLIVR